MQYNVIQSTILILSEVLWNDYFWNISTVGKVDAMQTKLNKFVANLGSLDDLALFTEHISADVPEVNKCA